MKGQDLDGNPPVPIASIHGLGRKLFGSRDAGLGSANEPISSTAVWDWRCLLLTEDATLLSAIRAQFTEFDLGLIMRKDVALAIELPKRRHLDGFVIDCDEVSGEQKCSAIFEKTLRISDR